MFLSKLFLFMCLLLSTLSVSLELSMGSQSMMNDLDAGLWRGCFPWISNVTLNLFCD